ncbi:MAG: hypothetical protein A2711_10725 [Burkholderiales bacterium RIFCSPHIGHO2_01_FULL_63_240]|jgi:hypothetical protein|nr:MAG: hypothetical protein A2711_10725 [Burkholderiales bacterium RIFCSPHIGHO2_01_FULL_63_240]
MQTSPDALIRSSGRSRRFDWWQALVRVLSSIEAVRDGRAMYMLLAAYAGAGTSMASAIRAYGQGQLQLAIGLGTAALFIAFYGSNAAGLMLMDRATGRPVRDPRDAVFDALGIGHRVLLALVVMLLAAATLAAAVLGLYWLSGLGRLGVWLFALAVPVTVLLIGLAMLAGVAVVAPLTGPTVWSGDSSWQAVRTLWRLIRERLLQAAVLTGGVSLATGLVGAATSAMVLVGGRVMAEASVYVLGVNVPPQALMAGLFGRTVMITDVSSVSARDLTYISAASVGGGVIFALALVLPTLVYLRGVCEVYLALQAADEAEALDGLPVDHAMGEPSAGQGGGAVSGGARPEGAA